MLPMSIAEDGTVFVGAAEVWPRRTQRLDKLVHGPQRPQPQPEDLAQEAHVAGREPAQDGGRRAGGRAI